MHITVEDYPAGADMLSVPLSKTIISNFELVVYNLVQKHQGNYLILHNFLQNYINNLLLFPAGADVHVRANLFHHFNFIFYSFHLTLHLTLLVHRQYVGASWNFDEFKNIDPLIETDYMWH